MFTKEEKSMLLNSLLAYKSNNEKSIFDHEDGLRFLKKVNAANEYVEYHMTEIKEAKDEIEKIDRLYKKINKMKLT